MIFKVSSIAYVAAISFVAVVSVQTAVAFVPTNGIISSSMTTHSTNRDQKKIMSTLNMSDNDDWTPSKTAMVAGAGVNNAGEPPFEIRGFSLGNFVIFTGIVITILSFAEYLGSSAGEGLNVSGLGFVYGVPVTLAGAALKYAEIDPVPCISSPAAERVSEAKATEIISKIKQDVTRHRYGDEAHLDTTVKKLGLVVPGKDYPQLKELREDVDENGELEFTMVWQSFDTPYKMWADERRVSKYATFFGPGVTADIVKIDAEQRLVGIKLTTTSSASPTTDTTLETTTTA